MPMRIPGAAKEERIRFDVCRVLRFHLRVARHSTVNDNEIVTVLAYLVRSVELGNEIGVRLEVSAFDESSDQIVF